MKSLLLAILMGVMLPLAAAAQAGGKDVVVPSGHPAADLKTYDKYEDVLDRIEADRAADLKAYIQYEDVLDRIAAHKVANLKPYDQYEDVLDRIAAYKIANLKPYDQYEDVLDRIEVYLAELQKVGSGIAQRDDKDR